MNKLEKYIINLDLPVKERLDPIYNLYEDEIKVVIPYLKQIIGLHLAGYEKILFPIIKTYKFFNKLMYRDELEYIANKFNIDFEYVLLLQLIYEATSCCTSIVTKVSDEFTMFRTMDWPLDFLKKFTIDVEYQRNGYTLFYGTTWLGYVGFLTMTIPSVCSIAINYRRTEDITFLNMVKNTFKTLSLNWPIGYLIRHIGENFKEMQIIKLHLTRSKLISPCYITICYSNKNPEIITRTSTTSDVHTRETVVQTNCDQHKFEPNILYSVERRKMAHTIINCNDNNFKSDEDLIEKLYSEPIKNDETIYLSIMKPSIGEHYTLL